MTLTLKAKPLFMSASLALAALASGCSAPETTSPTTSQSGDTAIQQAAAPQISVQLWSVKDALKADFKGTLSKLAGLGFDGVEFAGDFGPYAQDPQGLKAYLASVGLTASGAHVPFNQLDEDFDKTVAFYQALGISALIVPWEDRAFSKDDVQAFADDLTTLSVKLAPLGMQVGFHNHAQEWADYGDSSFLEYIAEHTPESVILQQDVGWTINAGQDPIAFVQNYPGRTLTTHFKSDVAEDSDYIPIIGQDNISWSAIYQATVNDGGAEWIVIEQEVYPNGMTPMEAVAESKAGFDTIISQ
ncbi:sugar phosphate isomerase/epimerase family protein [Alteromonas gilva]|uniref:Sugar phosphate isomerase/epimerase n=1 Tax=Alteromonas gilva TaxID=2987522 RepID=A0ABT5KZI6_9ALTE|nr:sugar phosphate isomerase/epimerase [Alteromonas gilva]MDC8830193.1 sugar phosphate isomerase/epimerase [Alteromonas gilva]